MQKEYDEINFIVYVGIRTYKLKNCISNRISVEVELSPSLVTT